MTKAEIIDEVKKHFEECFKYTSKEKSKKSAFFVSCVENEIGRIAFDNDYEITTTEVSEIVAAVFE